MLRIPRTPRILARPALQSVRRLATTPRLFSQSNPHSKIHALPFKLSEEKARSLIDLTAYVNEHTFASFFKILGSAITRTKPKVDEKAQDLELRKAYLPFWYLDIAVSGKGTALQSNMGNDEKDMQNSMLGMAFDSYWPGFVFDPLHYVSFGKPHNQDIQDAVPFSPSMYQDVEDIEVIPFSVSPLLDIADRVDVVNDTVIEGKEFNYQMNDVQLEFAAAYPLYWPVYIAKFKVGEDEERTIVLAAHKDDPFFLQWEPDREGYQQWLNNGSWLNADVTEPFWKIGYGQKGVLHNAEQMYLNDVVGQFGVGGDTIDWEDKRILAYPVHNGDNKEYLTKMYSYWAKTSMLKMIQHSDSTMVGFGKGKFEILPVEKMIENTEKEIEEAKAEMEEARPKWLSEGSQA
ncbi:hypothetical protein K450DRAFT_241175 [Umbelopsis ramanniana AG]|uniref:Uncharacterized protein n=1 Tax=Umbelopsis ramanniana AG TaxID=1314678 RepID=A0AAD5HD28_UMBRA|nr:uncharacterized protein K450DRAFT_241175 [Umbelopsis ramanniana AG]KAI8579722.1 hypothetical protein K450DRAFT_241175 [Umbelopsis ramanniana AG]